MAGVQLFSSIRLPARLNFGPSAFTPIFHEFVPTIRHNSGYNQINICSGVVAGKFKKLKKTVRPRLVNPMTTTAAPLNLSPPSPATSARTLFNRLLIPLLAVVTAVIIGSVLIVLAGLDPIKAYSGLWQGAFGTDAGLVRTLTKMTPLILSGLAVAFAFKGGLFNIGAQGQLVIGSILSAWVGFGVSGLAPALHIFLALAAGVVGGALWGLIPGLLKAYTGAHEVISTIMLNYIAGLLVEWAVTPAQPDTAAGPLAACQTLGSCNSSNTPNILPSAFLPSLYNPPASNATQLHIGVFFAIAIAFIVAIVIYRTTFGFEIRMVGLNPRAARYAGINVPRMTVMTLVIAGSLAGLAGAIQTQGINHRFETNQSLSTGFDSIAVSLLAANDPIAIIPSAFLFGALDSGSTQMQTSSGVPNDLIKVLQALILMFIAADQIIRSLYRIKGTGTSSSIKLSSGWGQR